MVNLVDQSNMQKRITLKAKKETSPASWNTRWEALWWKCVCICWAGLHSDLVIIHSSQQQMRYKEQKREWTGERRPQAVITLFNSTWFLRHETCSAHKWLPPLLSSLLLSPAKPEDHGSCTWSYLSLYPHLQKENHNLGTDIRSTQVWLLRLEHFWNEEYKGILSIDSHCSWCHFIKWHVHWYYGRTTLHAKYVLFLKV